MSQQRFAGWWLPEPNPKYRCGNSETRTNRMRFFAAWTIRGVLLLDACFGGLMFTEADMTFFGALMATGMFTAGSCVVIVAVLAAIWSNDL